jgi:hypothetical protein
LIHRPVPGAVNVRQPLSFCRDYCYTPAEEPGIAPPWEPGLQRRCPLV